MSYKIITDTYSIDRQAWNNFVHNHPNGNIFQTPEFFSTLRTPDNIIPLSIFLTNFDNEIEGVLIGEYLFENKFYKSLTRRAVIRGGPLIKNNSAEKFKTILNEYIKLFGSK